MLEAEWQQGGDDSIANYPFRVPRSIISFMPSNDKGFYVW
jgi:hypothetical protein